MILKNDIIELDIIDIGVNGEGIGHHEGYTFFVPLALVGERVIVRVEHISKTLVFSKLSKIIIKSPKRVDPPCKYYYQCGGCDLMHVNYETQLEYKRSALKTTLCKMLKSDFLVEPIIPSDFQSHYRNKVQLPFGTLNGEPILGFYKANSHNITPIDDCLLHGPWLKPLISLTLSYVSENKIPIFQNGKGILRHLVARYIFDKLCVTLVSAAKKLPNLDSYYKSLSSLFPDVSLYLCINFENNNVIMGNEVIHVAGPKQTLEVMGIKVSLNPLSFFQVNDNIREKLYSKVISLISPSHSVTVIDAYSGVGLMGAIMAKMGAHIINIDEVPEAIEDANNLYSANDISSQATNICGDCAEVLPSVIPRIDPACSTCLLLDPPRKGLSDKLINTINSLKSTHPNLKIVYISCNPSTLARDIHNLGEENLSFQPYDMFAQTKHLETLVCLTRKS